MLIFVCTLAAPIGLLYIVCSLVLKSVAQGTNSDGCILCIQELKKALQWCTIDANVHAVLSKMNELSVLCTLGGPGAYARTHAFARQVECRAMLM